MTMPVVGTLEVPASAMKGLVLFYGYLHKPNILDQPLILKCLSCSLLDTALYNPTGIEVGGKGGRHVGTYLAY
jgi:hypothetical protein